MGHRDIRNIKKIIISSKIFCRYDDDGNEGTCLFRQHLYAEQDLFTFLNKFDCVVFHAHANFYYAYKYIYIFF